MEFLEYPGVIEADGKEALDPITLEQLETDGMRTEKPAEKKKGYRTKGETPYRKGCRK